MVFINSGVGPAVAAAPESSLGETRRQTFDLAERERIAAPSGQNARKEHIRLPTDKQRINAVVAAFSCCGTGVAPSLITPTSMDPKQSKDPRR